MKTITKMEPNNIVDVETVEQNIDKKEVMADLLKDYRSKVSRSQWRKALNTRRRCKSLHPRVGDRHWLQWQKAQRLQQIGNNANRK